MSKHTVATKRERTEFNRKFREYLDRWSEANPDLTQQDLADACGVSRDTIQNGARLPRTVSYEVLSLFADTVGLSKEERLDLEALWLEDRGNVGPMGSVHRALFAMIRRDNDDEKRRRIFDELVREYRRASS